MLRIKCRLAIAAVVGIVAASHVASGAETPEFVRVTTKDRDVFVGELIEETELRVRLFDFKTAEEVEVARAEIKEVRRKLSEAAVVALAGMPNVLAWKISKSLSLEVPTGKIVKIDAFVVYASLGEQHGVKQGDELLVFRITDEIRDPDTGEVLGSERQQIGRLLVSSVEKKLCKAMPAGDVEFDPVVGDLVETAESARAIAVLPFVDSNGDQTVEGLRLSEEIVSGLTNRGIPLVERTRLVDALGELAIQQTALFDAQTAQRVGGQIGAVAIITGTIIPRGRAADVNVRLVNTETGEILLAVRAKLSGHTRDSGAGFLRADHSEAADTVGEASSTDLIQLLDPTTHPVRGSIEIDDGTLLARTVPGKDLLLNVPFALPSAYRIDAVVAPLDNDHVNDLAFYLTNGRAEFIAVLSKDNTCLITIDGQDPRSNGSARKGAVFSNQKPNSLVIIVTSDLVSITVNDKSILEFKELGRLPQGGAQPFQIGVSGCNFRFDELTITAIAE